MQPIKPDDSVTKESQIKHQTKSQVETGISRPKIIAAFYTRVLDASVSEAASRGLTPPITLNLRKDWKFPCPSFK